MCYGRTGRRRRNHRRRVRAVPRVSGPERDRRRPRRRGGRHQRRRRGQPARLRQGPGPRAGARPASRPLAGPTVAAELADELGPRFPSIEYERKGGIVVATTEPGAAALLAFAATQRAGGRRRRAAGRRRGARARTRPQPGRHGGRALPAGRPGPAGHRHRGAARLRAPRGAVVRTGRRGDRARSSARTGGSPACAPPQGDLSRTRSSSRPAPGPARSPSGSASSLPVRPRRGMVLVTSPDAAAHPPQGLRRRLRRAPPSPATPTLQTSSVVESTRGRHRADRLEPASRSASTTGSASTCSAQLAAKAVRPVPVPRAGRT